MWLVKPLETADLPAAAAFVARLQTDPAHHIAYMGAAGADEVAAAFSSFDPDGLAGVRVAVEDGRLVGLLGADVSAELRRVWWYGPLVEHADWDAVADALYAACSAALRAHVREEEMFLDATNSRAAAFGVRQGFIKGETEIGMRLGRDQQERLPSLSAPVLPSAWRAGFTLLHDRLFPKTYFSGGEILKRIGPHDRVFAVIESGIFLGYAYARAEPEFGGGILDYVGVAEPARRRGIGYQLTVAALRWLFSIPGVEAVTLTVEANNQPAHMLYQSLGFAQTYRFLPLRRKRL